MASMNSTATGRSTSCSGVCTPNRLTIGPNGTIEKARKAGMTMMTGASR